jgi:hypothetical protein
MAEAREITERYHLGSVIGTVPGMRSLRALDRATGEAVVFELVPRPPTAGDDLRNRFLAAATTLTELRSPSLPAVLDYGVTAEGDLFLVREADVGRDLEALAGESPVQVLGLLLQAVDALAQLDRHGLHHGALVGEHLRVVPGASPHCVLVGLARGLADGAAAGELAAERRRRDARALAQLACRLLGGAQRPAGAGTPQVELPLAVSFELEDGEALRALLERCLAADAGAPAPSWDEVRAGLGQALWGRRPPPAVDAPAKEAPAVKLTYSTEPPDAGLVPPGLTAPAAASPEIPEITKVVAEKALRGGEAAASDDESGAGREEGEDTAAALSSPAAEEPGDDLDDTRPSPDDTSPGLEPVSLAPRAPVLSDLPEELLNLPVPAAVAAGAPARAESPPEPPRPAAAAAASPEPPPPAAAAPTTPAAAPPPPLRRRRGRLLAAVLGAVALAAIGIVAVLRLPVLLPGSSSVAPPAPPAPTAPRAAPPASLPPPPEESAAAARDPRLLRAKILLAGGDDAGAAAVLAAIPPQAEEGFTAGDCALATLVRSTLAAAAEERLAGELTAALAGGDLPRLERALAGARGIEAPFLADHPDAAGELRRARRIAALDVRARQALAGGDPIAAIEAAGLLGAAFPGYAGAVELRERAASEIERAAEAQVAEGKPEAALERLLPLSDAWPDRSGLAERIEGVRERLRARRDLEEVIAAADAAGARGRPDEGLELLAGATPTDRLRPTLDAARTRLQARLADLDRLPPKIALAPGSAEEIVKGKPAEVVLAVSDDFRVERVRVFARPEGGRFAEVPTHAVEGEVVAEIPPELHQNKDVELYATAADPSGHVGTLGSADKPLRIRRRHWYDHLTAG